jgi:hypothetical protein
MLFFVGVQNSVVAAVFHSRPLLRSPVCCTSPSVRLGSEVKRQRAGNGSSVFRAEECSQVNGHRGPAEDMFGCFRFPLRFFLHLLRNFVSFVLVVFIRNLSGILFVCLFVAFCEFFVLLLVFLFVFVDSSACFSVRARADGSVELHSCFSGFFFQLKGSNPNEAK